MSTNRCIHCLSCCIHCLCGVSLRTLAEPKSASFTARTDGSSKIFSLAHYVTTRYYELVSWDLCLQVLRYRRYVGDIVFPFSPGFFCIHSHKWLTNYQGFDRSESWEQNTSSPLRHGRSGKKKSRKGRQAAESKKYKVKKLQKHLSTRMSLLCLCSAKRLVSSPYVRFANHPNVPVPVVAERRSNAHREHLRRDWMRLMFIGDWFKAAGWPGLKYLSASQNDATRKATGFQRSWSSKAQATSHWFVSFCSIPHDTTRVVSFLRENH